MRILLHAGMAKTGSTAIQETLASSREWLRRRGVLYPNLSEKTHHSVLLPAVLDEDEYLNNFSRHDAAKRQMGVAQAHRSWRYLEQEIERASPAVVILSSEYAFGLRHASLGRLIERLRQISDDVEATVYIRDPCNHYLSSAQQIVKYAALIKDPRVPLRYCAKLGKFEILLPGKVRKRVFSRDSLNHGDVTLDLLSPILPDPLLRDLRTISVNTALSAEAMAFLFRFNQRVWGDRRMVGHPMNKTVLSAIAKEEHLRTYTVAKLKDEIRSMVTKVTASDVIEMRRSHGLVFRNFDYAEAEATSKEEIHFILADEHCSQLVVSDIVAFESDLAEEMTMRVTAKLAQMVVKDL